MPAKSLMAMLVMGVGNVRMAVFQGVMPVPMRMWLSWWIVESMLMSMMFIVAMSVRMGLTLVKVLVLVMLGDM